MQFNIFTQLETELDNYFNEKITIGDGNKKSKRKPYLFSQFDTVEGIDYATASKFEKGEKDKDGTPKIYLNMVNFRAETASKNIDIDVSNFAFIPEDDASIYGALLLRKKFREWARENYYGEQINQMVDDFPKYGTVVVKKIGKEIEQIPLQILRNQQDAKDLQTASYVILDHKEMPMHELEAMPNWETSEIDSEWDTKVNIYERYGRVPLSFYKEYKGEEVLDEDDDKSIDVMAILAPEAKKESGEDRGVILFMEEVKERPFLEVHYKKMAGRWLGEGEVEKNLGNQVARNMIYNLRKRGLAWSVKNIYGSMDDTIANNLVQQVKDGDILKLSMAGGLPERIDTTNRANQDFSAMDNLIEENANQRSFTFEVSTGESLPSGTPFRLGAILSNTVNQYYGKKREQLGIFLSKIVGEFLIPVFEKENKEEGVISLATNEEWFDLVREAKKTVIKNKLIKEAALKGEYVDLGAIDAYIESEIEKQPIDFYKYNKDFWKMVKKTVSTETTGEGTNVPQTVESLTTLYQSMVQAGDPNAQKIVKRIMAMVGEKLPASSPSQAPQTPTGSPVQADGLSGLANSLNGQGNNQTTSQ